MQLGEDLNHLNAPKKNDHSKISQIPTEMVTIPLMIWSGFTTVRNEV